MLTPTYLGRRLGRAARAIACLGAAGFFTGCAGDDPGGSSGDPGALAHAISGSGSQSVAADAGLTGSLFGDPPDAAPSYRDPRAGDGACVAPNVVCGGSDAGAGDGGDGGAGVCVDVGSDALNCGACGNACMGSGAVCIARSCACSSIGSAYCPALGGCVDVTADTDNCGACGNVCDPGQFNACANGACVAQ